MLGIDNAVREINGIRPDSIQEEILEPSEPLVLRGLVADWPLVQAGLESADAADQYIRSFYDDATVGLFYAPPETRGRVFYNDDMSGFNYRPVMSKLDKVLDTIRQHRDEEYPPTIYVGSTTVDTCLPGFRNENDIDIGANGPLVSLWLGNRSRVAAHFDFPDNVACCAVGRRRFIVFPPDELENLYVGPLDFTPAGQAISMVDFDAPDLERFPRFEKALRRARVAELGPGDAIVVPSMWWHHVEAMDPFNVLVNYWWSRQPPYRDDPRNVLIHALLSIRDLPAAQRAAWSNMFRHYVFDFDPSAVSHVPEDRRGILGEIDETMARKIRASLLNRLNR